MIELITAMLIAAVVTVIAVVPDETDYAISNLENACNMIKEDIGYARSLALSTGRNHGVYLNVGASNKVDYDVYDTASAYTYGGMSNTYAPNPLTREDFYHKPLEKTHFGLVGDADYQVEFDSMGDPTIGGGGEIRLTSYRGDIYEVKVLDNTGLVQVLVISTN